MIGERRLVWFFSVLVSTALVACGAQNPDDASADDAMNSGVDPAGNEYAARPPAAFSPTEQAKQPIAQQPDESAVIVQGPHTAREDIQETDACGGACHYRSVCDPEAGMCRCATPPTKCPKHYAWNWVDCICEKGAGAL
jgi:hypothetical protein